MRHFLNGEEVMLVPDIQFFRGMMISIDNIEDSGNGNEHAASVRHGEYFRTPGIDAKPGRFVRNSFSVPFLRLRGKWRCLFHRLICGPGRRLFQQIILYVLLAYLLNMVCHKVK